MCESLESPLNSLFLLQKWKIGTAIYQNVNRVHVNTDYKAKTEFVPF